jgi:putative toxin-antitoxin system antitoxin component (TIGR02293 family)
MIIEEEKNNLKVFMNKTYKNGWQSQKDRWSLVDLLGKNELSVSEFKDFSDLAFSLGLTKKEYANYLHVNARTLDRNLKEKFTLDIDKTEKILLLWELMKRGIDVFGSEEKFSIWIREFNTALQKKPIDMFSTITGINLVNNLLTRIEYGVFS